jgi:N-acetylglutamate synthase-like GNAT family acetyltransferase
MKKIQKIESKKLYLVKEAIRHLQGWEFQHAMGAQLPAETLIACESQHISDCGGITGCPSGIKPGTR